MEQQLARIRQAYDLTVDQYEEGVDPLEDVPVELKDAPEFRAFMDEAADWCNSGSPDVREYLDPSSGLRFLDVGCAASLKVHRMHDWPSTYYGVDISPRLIEAMQNYVADNFIEVGGLYVADAANMPFEDDYFDIAAMIGVLEYCTFDYVESALREMRRVLKMDGKVVMDIPNSGHLHADMMFSLEECLGRPQYSHERSMFERAAAEHFEIESVDASRVMLKYFCRRRRAD
jgi:SAM-dependent methyltransferase